jgi:hypothetical protein
MPVLAHQLEAGDGGLQSVAKEMSRVKGRWFFVFCGSKCTQRTTTKIYRTETTTISTYFCLLINKMKGSIALILASSVAVDAYNKQELVLQDASKIGEVSQCCVKCSTHC